MAFLTYLGKYDTQLAENLFICRCRKFQIFYIILHRKIIFKTKHTF